jgi:hypothetical protein
MPSVEKNSQGKPLNILDGRQSPGFFAIDPSRIAFPEIKPVPLTRLRSLNWSLIAVIFFSLACWIILFGLT